VARLFGGLAAPEVKLDIMAMAAQEVQAWRMVLAEVMVEAVMHIMEARGPADREAREKRVASE
jgi:hypothetical protein